jgi:hypothetical protein
MTQLQSDLLDAAAYLEAESDDGATMTVAEAERIAKVLREFAALSTSGVAIPQTPKEPR